MRYRNPWPCFLTPFTNLYIFRDNPYGCVFINRCARDGVHLTHGRPSPILPEWHRATCRGLGSRHEASSCKKRWWSVKKYFKTCIYIPSPLFSFKMVCLLCVVGLGKISMQVAIHFIQENEKYQVRGHLSSSLGHGPRGEVITPVYYRESMSNRLWNFPLGLNFLHGT